MPMLMIEIAILFISKNTNIKYTTNDTCLKGIFDILNIIKLNMNIPTSIKVLYVTIDAIAQRIKAISFDAPLNL